MGNCIQIFVFLSLIVVVSSISIPTTLDGPFEPVTSPLDQIKFRGLAVDLPESDPRVKRRVEGFEPEQISVSLSATEDSVWISWITGDFQIGEEIKPLDPTSVASIVQFGTNKSNLTHKAVGSSLIYNQLYPFEGCLNYTSGIIHHVRLTGLKPSTKYFYKCGDPSLLPMSSIHSFTTMPASSPQNYPRKIAIVGDLGLTYNSTSTIEHMRSNEPDLVVLVGDVSYANLYLSNGTGSDCYSCSFGDSPIHETYQPRWDFWGRYMEDFISETPIMIVEGNHELEEQVHGKIFEAYKSRLAFPSSESGSNSEFYYSFNAGGIHFIMLGAYTSYNQSGEQYKWLEKDLEKVDRSVTPWLIATWHAPWYSTYRSHYKEAECMRVEMEEILYSYGVDVVFNGHVHAYERSNRIYNFSLNPCGPVHITVGDGGNRENLAISHADDPGNCPDPLTTHDPKLGTAFCAKNFTEGPAKGKFCWDRQPEYSAYRESSFGHGILEVVNETHALWTWHRNQDLYNSAGDVIYIVREPEKCGFKTNLKKNEEMDILASCI
ncbi:hypothetical protein LUZ60_007982 [Juncus effusus]|nr:hypothetical protein LUZ60_007982 [Juncus effusus]